MLGFTVHEITTFLMVQLVLSSVGFVLDLMVLNKKYPYAFVGSFLANALIILGFVLLK